MIEELVHLLYLSDQHRSQVERQLFNTYEELQFIARELNDIGQSKTLKENIGQDINNPKNKPT